MALTDEQNGGLLFLVISRQHADPASDSWQRSVESAAKHLRGFELESKKFEALMQELRGGDLTTLEQLLGIRPVRKRPGESCFD